MAGGYSEMFYSLAALAVVGAAITFVLRAPTRR